MIKYIRTRNVDKEVTCDLCCNKILTRVYPLVADPIQRELADISPERYAKLLEESDKDLVDAFNDGYDRVYYSLDLIGPAELPSFINPHYDICNDCFSGLNISYFKPQMREGEKLVIEHHSEKFHTNPGDVK